VKTGWRGYIAPASASVGGPRPPPVLPALSPLDLARFEAAAGALLLPLANPDPEVWRSEVLRTLGELFRAERTSFSLAFSGAPGLQGAPENARPVRLGRAAHGLLASCREGWATVSVSYGAGQEERYGGALPALLQALAQPFGEGLRALARARGARAVHAGLEGAGVGPAPAACFAA
jgi:hypothetical protein